LWCCTILYANLQMLHLLCCPQAGHPFQATIHFNIHIHLVQNGMCREALKKI
jgi:hypothetical protein